MEQAVWLQGACGVAGVTALAASALYALYAVNVRRGRAVAIRSDRYLALRAVCLVPFFIVSPILFVRHVDFPGTWVVVVLFFRHLAAFGGHMLSALHVRLYNVSREEALLAVRRALVLVGIKFREKEDRFFLKNEPLATVTFKEGRPEGAIRMLQGHLPLYRLFAASATQSQPTPGASCVPFLLSALEMLCLGAGSLILALLRTP